MPDPTLGATPASRALRAVVVLLAHGMLVLGLRLATQPEQPALARPSPTTWLRWVSVAPPAPLAGAPNDLPAPTRTAHLGQRPGTSAPPAAAITANTTPTAIDRPPAAVPPDASPIAAAVDPPSALPRLNLDLPWRRPAAPASAPATAGDLIRRNPQQPPRLTQEDRLARALGTDTTLQEDVLQGDVRRFRAGRGCVETRPTRAAQLDPFNGSARPVPKLSEPC